jgi:NifU-like protein
MDLVHLQLLRNLGYSERAIRLIAEQPQAGAIEHPTVYYQHQGSCGDIMELALVVEGRLIREARYMLTGCAGLQASAAALSLMIRGLTVEQAEKITADDIVAYLGGLPASKVDCAELARDTLQGALAAFAARHYEA